MNTAGTSAVMLRSLAPLILRIFLKTESRSFRKDPDPDSLLRSAARTRTDKGFSLDLSGTYCSLWVGVCEVFCRLHHLACCLDCRSAAGSCSVAFGPRSCGAYHVGARLQSDFWIGT